MRLVIIRPRNGVRLKARLDGKRRALQGRGGTFILDRKGKWVHAGYKGWINVRKTSGGLIVAEVNTKVPDEEWMILTAFIGFIDRHFREDMEWLLVQFVGEE